MRYHNENFDGTLDFRSRCHKSWFVELHLHEYSEILYCKSGEGDILINGRNIKLRAGEFIWIPPNYVHQYSFENAELVCAVFSNDFIPMYSSATGGKRLVVSAISADELSEMLEGLYLLKREQILKISGILNLVAEKVIENSEFQDADKTDGILFQKVVTYLSDHYTEDITLSGLSRLFGYNEKYLSHALHSLTGVHFSRLLASYRVERAKAALVAEPRKSIAEIAMESGFSAINSFHRVFLMHTGLTPSEYRKSVRKQNVFETVGSLDVYAQKLKEYTEKVDMT